MRKILWVVFALISSMQVKAQGEVIVAATAKKVIKAIDLKIQRQQNKVIWLQNTQKTIENIMSKLKLKEIGNWVEKQKNIYAEYFDELQKVKTLISYYQQIRDITGKQAKLVQEYKRAWGMLKSDVRFTPDEINFMGRVYDGILKETLDNIDQLFLVVNSFTTKMSDASRMKIIDEVDNKVDENLIDLRRFNNENKLLSLQRAKTESEIRMVKEMYGLKD